MSISLYFFKVGEDSVFLGRRLGTSIQIHYLQALIPASEVAGLTHSTILLYWLTMRDLNYVLAIPNFSYVASTIDHYYARPFYKPSFLRLVIWLFSYLA